MKASDIAKVWAWLENKKPGATNGQLQEVAEQYFGKIVWDSQMGWGEGMIICRFPEHGIDGRSCGQCTGEEALLDALTKLI